MQALKRLVQDFRLMDTHAQRSNITWTNMVGASQARIDYLLFSPNFGNPGLVLHAVAFSDQSHLSLAI